MIKQRINKLGKEQIESAKEIIICNRNAYSLARLGDNVPPVDPAAFVALAIFNNGNNHLVMAGDFGTWQFDDLKNGVRSIKRINKNVPITIYSDEEITKFVAREKAQAEELMNAVRKFNQTGNSSDLKKALIEKKLNFSKGDAVFMIGSHEATLPENQKTWICETDSFIDKSGDEVVFLEGYSGAYMCEYLDYVM